MIALLQRVSSACVVVDDRCIARIDTGILLFLGIEKKDTSAVAQRMLERILGYRIFPDVQGRMNQSLADVGGGLLVVSQFTLAADTRKGRRPSFSSAAPPEQARSIFDHFVLAAKARHSPCATGEFGADMKVSLLNDGPVTFLLQE